MNQYVSTVALLLAALTGVSVSAPILADSVGDVPLLRESYDPGLQDTLNARLRELDLHRAVARKELAVALVDMSRQGEPRLAEVNGDEMMYAASLPKIGILLAAFVEIERGRMTLDAATRKSLTDMIRVSSNSEATRMLNRVGKHRVNEILRAEPYRLYDPLVNGGIWVGKEYARGTAFQRDPLHNLSHGATALQTARFYYLLETGRLVNPELTSEMKRMLSRPGIKHKFVKGLAGKRVRMYRKSGTWRQWHADSVLVEADDTRYILVALASNAKGGKWMTRLAESVHATLAPRNVAIGPRQASR